MKYDDLVRRGLGDYVKPNFVTFFAVPIAVYRDVGPIGAIKGSTSLVKHTFGETATGRSTASTTR